MVNELKLPMKLALFGLFGASVPIVWQEAKFTFSLIPAETLTV